MALDSVQELTAADVLDLADWFTLITNFVGRVSCERGTETR
jgi:hypothetical protein